MPDRDLIAEARAAFARSSRQRHTWECGNRTKIGVPELDACDCPEAADRAPSVLDTVAEAVGEWPDER
ncbi:hypothetical protein ABZ412_34320 [Nocardia sp. NPDC005746]|uniref:hypothetical protein n=1 Tax=Nocardia sp. NPDC005746 TaxID=3157062 RepID=UPI0034043FEF